MAFRIASALGFLNTTTNDLTIVAPAGTVATDTILAVPAVGVSAGAGSVSVAGSSTVVAYHQNSNMWWGVFKLTGLVAGDSVTASWTGNSAINKQMQLFVFTQDVGATVGAVGSRASSSATVTAPAITITTGQPVLALALERSTASNTVTGAVSSTGETVTQLSFSERVGDPDVSFYLGRFTNTTNPTGSVTLTYSGASGNAGAVLIQETVAAAPTAAASPVYSIAPAFSAGAINPNAAVTYKGASALNSTSGTATAVAPAGTVASDYIYLFAGWGTNALRTPTVTAPAAAVPGQVIVMGPRSDTNLGWVLVRLTGVVAGQTVTASMTGSGVVLTQLFVFDQPLAPSGLNGHRTGSSATTVIPAVPTIANKPVFLFAVERTLVDGTALSSANNANGTTVTTLSYGETAADPDISVFLGVLTPPTTDSGAVTLVYTSASGNAGGVAFPSAAAPAAASPSYGIGPSFGVAVTPPAGLIRVNLGRPSTNAIRVKALTKGATSIRLAVSTAASMTAPVLSPIVAPDAAGYSALTTSGLLPDTVYYWQVQLDGVLTGTVNVTRTWPTAGAVLPVAALLVGACTRGFGTNTSPSNPNTFSFMRNMVDGAGKPARLMIDLGDNFYAASHGSPGGDIIPPNPVIVRNWWEAQHQQTERTAFHKAIPTAHSYSDNDFIGSNSDSTEAPDISAMANTVRQQVLSDAPGGATDGKGLYWSALLGRVLLIHTDSRTYSSNVLLPNSTPGKSMLGAAQKAWLKTQFARVDHQGIIWFHDNQWVGSPVVSSARPGVDNWQAFSVERQELSDYITNNNVKILLYVHGDNHGMAFDNGLNNNYGGFPWAMVAPMYQDAQVVTLVTSGDAYPPVNLSLQQYFTWLEITDTGATVTVRLTGYNVTSGTLEPLISGTVVNSGSGAHLSHEFFGTIQSSDVGKG